MRARYVVLAILALIAAPLALVIGGAGPAGAAIFVVDDLTDGAPVGADCTDATPNNCSPRDAFAAADGNGVADTIQLAAGADYSLTFCPGGMNGSLAHNVSQNLTIEGNGATVRQTCALGASNGVIQYQGSTTLTVNNVTLTGGNSNDNVGAIQAGNDDVTINLNNSTLTGNTGGSGAGIGTAGTVNVQGSTISNNIATNVLGGGGIRALDNTVTIINSTITGNTGNGVEGGGGIRTDVNIGTGTAGNLVLQYSTVVGNSSSSVNGDNVSLDGATLQSFGSVVALPGDGTGPNCAFGAGGSSSQGYNFKDANTCGFGAGPGDVPNGGNPLLAALANNGGPTQTRLPATTSPLVNKIPATSPCAGVNIVVDQRGVARPTTPGRSCDIGAVELAEPPDPAVTVTPRFTG